MRAAHAGGGAMTFPNTRTALAALAALCSLPMCALPALAQDFPTRAVKIVGVSDDRDLVARCEKDAQDALGARASAARSQPYYLDITHPDANKGTVVTTLSKLLSIPAAEIATIGSYVRDRAGDLRQRGLRVRSRGQIDAGGR